MMDGSLDKLGADAVAGISLADASPSIVHLESQSGNEQTPHATPLSLEGLHGTVAVPSQQTGYFKQWRAFVGPALLVSVGYMDPGNWGTDLSAGRLF